MIAVLMSSCATTPKAPKDPRMTDANNWWGVKVNSFVALDASSKGKTYVITSAMQNVSDNDLEFQEFARYIDNALSPRGYVKTDKNENADLLIRLGYGIGAPQTTRDTYTTSTGYSYPVGSMWFTVPPSKKTVQSTKYMRNLVLEAYDLKDPNRKSQLWKTTVTSKGSTSDLRIALAYMVAASGDYFGINTGKQLEIKIWGDDPRVLDIWK